MLLQCSNLSFRVLLEQQQPSFKPVTLHPYWHTISSIHLYYHMYLDFGFPDKSNMFYSQAEEGFLNASLAQTTACNITMSQACHKCGISLKLWSRAEPRSEPWQQPIPYAPIISYSIFSLWQISNSRAYEMKSLLQHRH